MSDSTASLGPLEFSSAEAPPLLKRHVAAVVIGNALEFYDFTTYAYFATQIGNTFFPSKSPFVSLMASLAAFGIGFAARPVGGIFIGAYGDRKGRKAAMMFSFVLMGVAILLLAATPSFASIGIAAPVIVVIARLLQGLAVGGDVGPTTAFLLEAAPPMRRGFYTSLQYSSQGVSTLLAGLVGAVISSVLDVQSLQDYGWRMAFLIGAVILPIGFIIRRALPETLHADEIRLAEPVAARPWRAIVLGFFMLSGATIGFYVLAYLTTYAANVLHMKANVGFAATAVFGLANIIFSALAGILSDRFGRKPVMVISRLLFVFAIYPAFRLIIHNHDTATLLIATFVLGALGQMSVVGFVAVSEALPKQVRSASLATVYALAITVFGGTTQLNVTWLLHTTGDPMAPAWYLLFGGVLCLGAMLLMKETAPVVLSRQSAREPSWKRAEAGE